MLIFFVFCTFLRTLQGASVPPPPELLCSSVALTNTPTLIGCECPAIPEDGGQQLRTVYDIVQSCLLTIFACVWTSGHPNINGLRDSGWTGTKRRLITMLWTVIAPELVLIWASRQYFGAKKIALKYNKAFARPGEAERSLWRKVAGWFQPLPKAMTWRGVRQPWTTTHGFFVQMGGFVLYEDEYPTEVLDYHRLEQLLRDQSIDPLTVSERELKDRSKGDAISKGIVVLQTTWFVIQCIARGTQRLPLSELEVLTLAFAVMNAAIYAVWWNKPQGVETAICIPLKGAKKEVDTSTTQLTSQEPTEQENQPQSDPQHTSDDLPLRSRSEHQHPDKHVEETSSWFWRTVRKDYQNCGLLYFLFVRFPLRVLIFVLRPAGKMATTFEFKRKTHLRMPMFYSINGDGDEDNIVLGVQFYALSLVTTIFGAIHLIAWTAKLPSHRDVILWRISAVVVTANPLLLLLMALPAALEIDAIGMGLVALSGLMIPFYIVARVVLIILALKAIWHASPGVLSDISWTSYIPHL